MAAAFSCRGHATAVRAVERSFDRGAGPRRRRAARPAGRGRLAAACRRRARRSRPSRRRLAGPSDRETGGHADDEDDGHQQGQGPPLAPGARVDPREELLDVRARVKCPHPATGAGCDRTTQVLVAHWSTTLRSCASPRWTNDAPSPPDSPAPRRSRPGSALRSTAAPTPHVGGTGDRRARRRAHRLRGHRPTRVVGPTSARAPSRATSGRSTRVHDRTPQIRLRVLDAIPVGMDPDERVVDEILGRGLRTGQDHRELHHRPEAFVVEVEERRRERRRTLGRGGHVGRRLVHDPPSALAVRALPVRCHRMVREDVLLMPRPRFGSTRRCNHSPTSAWPAGDKWMPSPRRSSTPWAVFAKVPWGHTNRLKSTARTVSPCCRAMLTTRRFR